MTQPDFDFAAIATQLINRLSERENDTQVIWDGDSVSVMSIDLTCHQSYLVTIARSDDGQTIDLIGDISTSAGALEDFDDVRSADGELEAVEGALAMLARLAQVRNAALLLLNKPAQ